MQTRTRELGLGTGDASPCGPQLPAVTKQGGQREVHTIQRRQLCVRVLGERLSRQSRVTDDLGQPLPDARLPVPGFGEG